MEGLDPYKLEDAIRGFMRETREHQSARNAAAFSRSRDEEPLMSSRKSELHPTPFPTETSTRTTESPEETAAEGGESGSFCGTFVEGSNTYLNGGSVNAGENTFFLAPYNVGSSDGQWLVQVRVNGIEFATDDDEEIFLPGGVESASGASWNLKAYSPGTNYDDHDNPATPSDTGTAYVPIGYLKIDDDVVTFRAEACGPVTITQCAGILSVQR